MRLFVAAPIPADVAASAAAAVPDLPALRRVAPELMHVTLAFIGALDQERLNEVVDAARAVADHAPFDVSLDSLGAFYDRGTPRVVWIGIGDGAPQLTATADAVRRALAARGVPFDAKPFRGHATLGRVRERATPEDTRAVRLALERAAAPRLRFRCDRIVVFESAVSPNGPRYTPRAVVPLGSGAAP